jgi:hypothetical protein
VWSCALPHEHNKVGVSVSNLWHDCICIKNDHELWDGGGPMWCIMLKKMSEVILKDGMTGWAKWQALKLGPTQDLSWMQRQFENNSEIMLKNECSCTFSKMFSWTRFVFLSNSCSNSEMKTWTTKGRRSWTHLRWTWNGSGPKLLALIKMNNHIAKI